MQTINVNLDARSYPINIGHGFLDALPEQVASMVPGKIMIVSDDIVFEKYGKPLLEALQRQSRDCYSHVCEHGESAKSLENWHALIDEMVAQRLGRDAAVIAIGGGVIGDLAGFAAACYMRGIRVIQIPTSLLAQLDSSVGGKTAVNHAAGKNLVGAFHQPTAVFVDTATLSTLDERNYRAGFAEAVKMAMVADAKLFEMLEENVSRFTDRDRDFLGEMIYRCCKLKARIVETDERECGMRALLNFGHTFAHGLEKLGEFGKLLHGEAVAIGIVLASRASCSRLGLAAEVLDRCVDLLQRAGLPVAPPPDISAAALAGSMLGDKKSSRGDVRLVLLDELGHGELQAPMELPALRTLLGELGGIEG